MKEKKVRIDQLVVNRGLALSRSRAASLILSGVVMCDDSVVSKAGYLVEPSSKIKILKPDHPWVSRGGIKLDYALKKFGYKVPGVVAVDVGASTGGFTDVLLQHGAKKVYAVDVGYGQLSWKLRKNSRVVVMERINSRYISDISFEDLINFIVCDVSFISIKKALPSVLNLSVKGSRLVALIKPQFEVEKKDVQRGGVVRDNRLQNNVCEKINSWLEEDMHWLVEGIIPSPIEGPAGNKEFFIAAVKK
ncbi:MAG: TlyA family rRNA (cytidine-2'-O)-methyltransferase [Rhodospirillaceae bacterium]|nr:TlyA family rRNA (cytidine-2'-O)-methyltransferase [Rhodospirillaceae bacterium]